MTIEWESHVGEEQLSVAATSAEEALIALIGAFSDLVGRGGGGVEARREITVSAPDLPGLVVELLNELVYLAETQSFVAERASVELDRTTLRATLSGCVTHVSPLVKAATYHDLEFERRGDVWHARVVLDV